MPSPEKPTHSTLLFLLQQSIDGAKEIILSGLPKHWPTVYCILISLVFAHQNLLLLSDYIDTAECAGWTLAKAIIRLSRLFLACCQDLHPLSDNFDVEWFGLSVGGSEAACEFFGGLREEYETWLRDSLKCPMSIPQSNSSKCLLVLIFSRRRNISSPLEPGPHSTTLIHFNIFVKLPTKGLQPKAPKHQLQSERDKGISGTEAFPQPFSLLMLS
ncbi:hypothetical protein BDV96DRAFT_332231 [Lophiotrema nucula]|uniref:Uncharacterized protein n=1 Tax=Lophiotrema nucula TaxID=690887 RepID=A0A6A5YJH8_9PLEO|nr:hypothetical protein BDV96DRAFT_332231 [Lophiotrema nucula]